ncbi:MAG: NAD-dependent epimerase/dehydratase family protein [Saprospiraceae bacterium]
MKEIKILVTGASGFIGSYAVPILSEKYQIVSISLQEKTVNEINLENYDVILHLSGIAHQNKVISGKMHEAVNYQMTVDLAGKAKEKGIRHFIFLSTVKVFGESTAQSLNEISPCFPVDDYARSKYRAESDILKMNSDSFIVSVVRPALVYGKGVKGNLAKLIALVRTLPIIPLDGINNSRSLVYAGNLIALIDRIIEKKIPGIFIACDVNNISTSQLIRIFAKHLKKRRLFISIPGILKNLVKSMAPSGYKRLFGTLVVDSSMTNQVLDFKPPYSVEEGMKKMFE